MLHQINIVTYHTNEFSPRKLNYTLGGNHSFSTKITEAWLDMR